MSRLFVCAQHSHPRTADVKLTWGPFEATCEPRGVGLALWPWHRPERSAPRLGIGEPPRGATASRHRERAPQPLLTPQIASRVEVIHPVFKEAWHGAAEGPTQAFGMAETAAAVHEVGPDSGRFLCPLAGGSGDVLVLAAEVLGPGPGLQSLGTDLRSGRRHRRPSGNAAVPCWGSDGASGGSAGTHEDSD